MLAWGTASPREQGCGPQGAWGWPHPPPKRDLHPGTRVDDTGPGPAAYPTHPGNPRAPSSARTCAAGPEPARPRAAGPRGSGGPRTHTFGRHAAEVCVCVFDVWMKPLVATGWEPGRTSVGCDCDWCRPAMVSKMHLNQAVQRCSQPKDSISPKGVYLAPRVGLYLIVRGTRPAQPEHAMPPISRITMQLAALVVSRTPLPPAFSPR